MVKINIAAALSGSKAADSIPALLVSTATPTEVAAARDRDGIHRETCDLRRTRIAGERRERDARFRDRVRDRTGLAAGEEIRAPLAHAPRVLARAELMELMRGRDLDPFDRSVDVRVSRLRQTLGEDARSPQIIKTVYGEGYVIGVPVEKTS